MVNLLLYKSSCISRVVHLLFFISVIIIGLCTSIFNYKYINKLLQFLDRFVMFIEFIFNLYFIHNLSYIGLILFLVNLLFCSVCLYLNAKYYITKK